MSRALLVGVGRRGGALDDLHLETLAVDDDRHGSVGRNHEIMSRQLVADAALERCIVTLEKADDPLGRIRLEAL